jgi:hypothetical protein
MHFRCSKEIPRLIRRGYRARHRRRGDDAFGPGSALSPPESGPRLYIIWGLGGRFEVGEFDFWRHVPVYPFRCFRPKGAVYARKLSLLSRERIIHIAVMCRLAIRETMQAG